jgi:hypothetical protein
MSGLSIPLKFLTDVLAAHSDASIVSHLFTSRCYHSIVVACL